MAWQLEHEAFDPLGLEHSWRLSASFVDAELEALRQADPTRPVIMNGFLPTSWPVRLSQAWRTCGQGDSLAGARRRADIGDRFLPQARFAERRRPDAIPGRERHAMAPGVEEAVLNWVSNGPRIGAADVSAPVMVAEGQAEPWETVTKPPTPPGQAMSSCRPEHVISNYNRAMQWQRDRRDPLPLWSYLFWGAEYWLSAKTRVTTNICRHFCGSWKMRTGALPEGPPGARFTRTCCGAHNG